MIPHTVVSLPIPLVRHLASHNAIEFAFTTTLAPFAVSHVAFDYTSPETTCLVQFHPVSLSHEWGAVHPSNAFSNAFSLSLCSLLSSFRHHLQTSPVSRSCPFNTLTMVLYMSNMASRKPPFYFVLRFHCTRLFCSIFSKETWLFFLWNHSYHQHLPQI